MDCQHMDRKVPFDSQFGIGSWHLHSRIQKAKKVDCPVKKYLIQKPTFWES